MDRREFGKLFAAAVLVPSFVQIPEKQKLPVAIKYKGGEIMITERPDKGYAIQAYWQKGKYQGAQLFGRSTKMADIEKQMKLMVDRGIKRNS